MDAEPGSSHEQAFAPLRTESGFVCKVCAIKLSSVSSYCSHFKIHLSTKKKGILCAHEDCDAQLGTVFSFRSHYSKFHRVKSHQVQSSSLQEESGVPCPCGGCTAVITSKGQYLDHVNCAHLGKDVEECKSFTCIFEGCKSIMKNLQQFRTHVSRYHQYSTLIDMSSSSRPSMQPSQSSANQDEPTMDVDAESNFNASVNVSFDADSSNYDSDTGEPSEEELYPDYVIKDELARFYLKLEAVEVLPTSTVQLIASEIKLVTEMIHYKLKRALQKGLEGLQMDKMQINQVIRTTFQCDPIFNVHHKDCDTEHLATDHLRQKFWRKAFKFVEPVRVPLSFKENKKTFAHHVSIKESLVAMLEDKSVQKKVLESFEHTSKDNSILEDFTDGSAFQEHLNCHQLEGGKCLQLLLFQDGFDPQAFAGSGAYKPIGFYWTLGNIPAAVRSKLSLIQLAFMVLEKDLKNSEVEELQDFDRLKESLKPLIDELIDLRNNGIILQGERIPVCVLFLIGDSLGQNLIGRFVQNFASAQFSCRFCPMSKDEFVANPHETKPLRLPSEYDEYVQKAHNKWLQVRRTSIKAQQRARAAARQQAKRVTARCSAPSKKSMGHLQSAISKSALKRLQSINFRGVKHQSCPFNREELNFHVVRNQPPCLAHDLFEGVVKLVVPKVLKHFIDKNCFSLVTLNRRITSFKCLGTDALDRPKPVKSIDAHLKGNAVENWNFLRLLPFVIGDLIDDKEDPSWCIFLKLKEICSYVCAPRISRSQIAYLENLIEDYLTSIKEFMPECLTPKHHYLAHYPSLILLYGPLIRLFTLRFESKHALFKRIIRACKNFINITHTMARKYACRSAFDRSVNLLPSDLVYEDCGPLDTTIPEEVRMSLPRNIQQVKNVSILGTKYSTNQYLILDTYEGTGLKVGCIRNTFLNVCTNEVSFLLEESVATNSFSGYYQVQQTPRKEYSFQVAKDLCDYYPLAAYQFNGELCLSLKHSVICME